MFLLLLLRGSDTSTAASEHIVDDTCSCCFDLLDKRLLERFELESERSQDVVIGNFHVVFSHMVLTFEGRIEEQDVPERAVTMKPTLLPQ